MTLRLCPCCPHVLLPLMASLGTAPRACGAGDALCGWGAACCILPGCFGGLRTELLMDSSPCVPGKISPGLCWSLGLTTQRLCSRIFISALLGCVPGVSD